MNPPREELLFGLALEQPPDKRAAVLDAACGEDAALRGRVEARLAAYAEARQFDPAASAPREAIARYLDEQSKQEARLRLELNDAGQPRREPGSR